VVRVFSVEKTWIMPERKLEKIIAVLSDFGTGSFYVGAMKAAALRISPDVTLVDVTHDISAHAVLEGSFVLARVFALFPRGTVFLAIVDPGVGGSRNNLIFKAKGRYVVAPDNGLISDVVAEVGVDDCFAIDPAALIPLGAPQSVGRTFLGRDIFAPASAALASGIGCSELGAPVTEFRVDPLPSIELAESHVRGRGRYTDRFGNIITNISGQHLKNAFGGMELSMIRVYIEDVVIDGIRSFYAQVRTGEPLAVLGSWDLVEVSVNQGKASKFFKCGKPEDLILELRA
jgi:S-adenosylmethionine hydrolase